MTLLLAALAVLLTSAVVASFLGKKPRECSAVGAAGAVIGCSLGVVFAARHLFGDRNPGFEHAWSVPGGGIRLGCDPLSAFFLLPIFVLGGLASVYGREYLREHEGHKSLAMPWAAFDLMLASMALVVVARQAMLFLVAWEVMSIAAYLLVAFEHERPDVRRAGWVYLIATHVGTTVLLGLFVLLRRRAGTFDFEAFAHMNSSPSFDGIVFVLAVLGFGVKAGLVPLHVWLPEAHAAAPSHVSAVMSGVLVKMGLYGILRILVTLDRPASWWGPLLMVLGVAGAVLGISLALVQRDIKRVLAYSTVENVGIIVLGLGIGLWGRTSGRPQVAVLGVTGALLHVWNHTLMKGLMFLGAGSVLHSTGTRDLERMGGLLKRMPRTGLAISLGAIAIAGLPPLNGFVSEWLIYLGLIEGALSAQGTIGFVPLLSVGVLSFVGALAALCFVRLVGIALLGQPRSDSAKGAHESPTGMIAPMTILLAACVAFALAPRAIVVAFSSVLERIAGADPALDRAPGITLSRIGIVHGAIWIAIALVAGLWALSMRSKRVDADSTWGCGYAAPTSRMQYTARSFSELVSERLMPRILRPRTPRTPSVVGLLPQRTGLTTQYDDPLTREVYERITSRTSLWFARLRWFQQGSLHIYLLYILVVVVLALSWISIRAWRAG